MDDDRLVTEMIQFFLLDVSEVSIARYVSLPGCSVVRIDGMESQLTNQKRLCKARIWSHTI